MKIDIVSGFLGSGKTTLIKKLMKELYTDEKILIIENEFGEISIDATILRASGYELRELNSGCICCNISGDFEESLKDIVKKVAVDRIVIEPSGIANLSDIVKIAEKYAVIDRKIVVIDSIKFKMYLRNFEHFFKDQIQNANVIVFSRIEKVDSVDDHIAEVKLLNDKALIFAQSYSDYQFDKIDVSTILLNPYIKSKYKFFNKVIYFNYVLNLEQFNQLIYDIKTSDYLRVKGIVSTTDGYKHIEYASSQLNISDFEVIEKSSLVIISDKEIEFEN